MIYVLRDADGAILSYGEKDDWRVLPGQRVDVVQATMEEYAARFRLSADKAAIRADGVDTATVTVSTVLPLASVEVRVVDLVETVALSGGAASVQIAAETPGLIAIEPADPASFCRAGAGTLVIAAEEVL